MPKIGVQKVTETSDATPDTLKPYIFHGVQLEWRSGDKEAVGTCPWCDREGKFSVHIEKGTYRCLVCQEGTDKGGGNNYTMIRRLHKASMEINASERAYKALAKDRGLLDWESLRKWGVVPSISTRDWLVPGYGPDGKMNQLYRYINTGEKGMRLIPTPTMGHQIHSSDLWNENHSTIYVCEGPWDGIALEEILAHCKQTDEGLRMTGNPLASLLAKCNVVAVPGCSTFHDSWVSLFAGKRVILCYDSDYPRTVKGREIPPAGFTGLKKVVEKLSSASEPPAEIQWLNWGVDGYDHLLPDGYDVRDGLKAGETVDARIRQLDANIYSRISPVPAEWLAAPKGSRGGKGKDGEKESMVLLECESYAKLIQSWRKAMKWTDGLDHALGTMLAVVSSTKQLGDQLWIKVIGPPSCGKSTLCEAISTAKDYIYSKSTIRGFHSGVDDGSGEDYSPLLEMAGKTFVQKDGDTLLQAPNLSQILSEARDVYDTVSRSSYRTRKGGSDHSGIRITWILCGTSSLRQLDESELGARFLDCVIMEGIDTDLEDEILLRTVYKAKSAVAIEADGKPETHQEPRMTEAMKLTGGYVCWLRENAAKLLPQVEVSDANQLRIAKYGKFVAYFRARPSKRQEETAEREMAARLVSQHMRLAMCLAVVMNKKNVDAEIIKRVRRIALDTGRGVTLRIANVLYAHQEEGCEIKYIADKTGQREEDTRKLMRYLKQIGVAELFIPEVQANPDNKKKLSPRPRWRMTSPLVRLYRDVHAEVKDA